ncbi:MAG: D-alanyl-D-alanine carboxypeptidase family protein [Rickettsiales bacterium]
MVMNLNTGEILHDVGSDKHFYPASLTKVMTIYLAFKYITEGKINLDTELTTPTYATKLIRCKIDLYPGQKITVLDAIKATIISSANDASETLLYHLADRNRDNIPIIMNTQAKKLGMLKTKFINASGLFHHEQKTTARDLMKLSYAVRNHFPKLYKLFNETSYEFNGKTFKGHNKIIEKYAGAEGLKTGYLTKSGYNLISIATRNNVTLCGIIAGAKNKQERDQKMIQLLDKYFD